VSFDRPRALGFAGLLLAFVALSGVRAQEAPNDLASRLGLADLAAYRAALSGKATAEAGKAGDSVSPGPVSFRDLWDHPDTWSGRRVSIRGRLVRAFRQQAFGDFPPLVEAWLSTPQGDLFCVVHPQPGPEQSAAQIGNQVRFTGTFLKKIRYAAADTTRLAPLIVGDRPPVKDEATGAALESLSSTPAVPQPGEASRATALWPFGVALGLLITLSLLLAWYQLNKPAPTRRRRESERDRTRERRPGPDHAIASTDLPLEFLDPEA
jgi:hypothetical protein